MNEFPGSSEDDRMRHLLDDAVSDVEPRESLNSIRSRTVVTAFRSRRPWILGAGAAAVATAATVAAVAMMGGNPGTTTTEPQPPIAGAGSPTASVSETSGSATATKAPSTASTDGSPGTEPTTLTVPVYYVGTTSHGPRLYREFHSLSTSLSTSENLRAAVEEAVAGKPADPDYRSPWPAGARTGQVSFDGDIITVTLEPADGGGPELGLRERPPGMSEDEASIAIEQLIYTAQAAAQARAPVQFLINGERTDTVLGVPASEPLAEGDATNVLAQVWIIEPAEGARVQSPFTVSGLANAFEANVQWELMQGDAVIDSGFKMARECCTMAPYSFKVNAPPGYYTLVVHDSDPSGGEGFAPWRDTKTITLTE